MQFGKSGKIRYRRFVIVSVVVSVFTAITGITNVLHFRACNLDPSSMHSACADCSENGLIARENYVAPI